MDKQKKIARHKIAQSLIRNPPPVVFLRALVAMCALKENLPFTPEERQELVNRISKNSSIAKLTILEVPNLTEA